MTFPLVHVHFERNSKRACVELREEDADEMIVAAIFSFRRTSILTKRALEQEIATKARHLMRRASVDFDSEKTRSKRLPLGKLIMLWQKPRVPKRASTEDLLRAIRDDSSPH